MSDGVVIRSNAPEFIAALREWDFKLQRKVVRQATAAAAAVVRAAVRADAPVLKIARRGRQAGTLKRAVRSVRSRRLSKPGVEVYTIVPRTGSKAATKNLDAFYWYFLEHGWTPRGPGNRIRGGNRRRALERQRLRAGGASFKQIQFIEPAAKRVQGAAVEAFYARLTRGITELQAGR